MAADVKPSTWLGAGYSLNTGAHEVRMTTETAGTNICLPALTDAEGHATTGDIRTVALAFVDALYQQFLAADIKPKKMTIRRGLTGIAGGAIRATYSFTFEITALGDFSIPAEP